MKNKFHWVQNLISRQNLWDQYSTFREKILPDAATVVLFLFREKGTEKAFQTAHIWVWARIFFMI